MWPSEVRAFGQTYVPQGEPVQLYRWPHDIERYNYDHDDEMVGMRYMAWRSGKVRDAVINDPVYNPTRSPMPEVYRVIPDHVTPLSCRWLHLWYDCNKADLTPEKWATLLGPTLAWMNRTGSPPRPNCVTGYDGEVGHEDKNPAFHSPIFNGGAVFKGVEGDGFLHIETLLTSGPVPTAEYVLARPWLWFWGTSITREGRINRIMRMGRDGYLKPVRVPLMTRLPVRVPLSWVHKLEPGFVPPTHDWMP